MNDERLHRLRRALREGDPLAGETSLTPDEVREMRRTALTAIPEPRRRFLPALALAGAAAVAVLIAAVALWPGAPTPPRPPRTATVLPAPVTRPAAPEVRTPVREEEKRTAHPHRRHRRPAVTATPAESEALAAMQEQTPVREIQFSTPGGTRILWTFTPGKPSH